MAAPEIRRLAAVKHVYSGAVFLLCKAERSSCLDNSDRERRERERELEKRVRVRERSYSILKLPSR
jgi:hypothetical protein